jgi:hypothetical protein
VAQGADGRPGTMAFNNLIVGRRFFHNDTSIV